MPVVRKKPAAKAPVVATAAPRTVAKRRTTGASEAAAQKPVAVVRSAAAGQLPLVAPVPETKKAGAGKRQRLSKAFSRPLDKQLRKAKPVRERFTLPEIEYAQLAVLKKRLAERGMSVKKSQFVRAGLALVAALDDDALQALLAKFPALD